MWRHARKSRKTQARRKVRARLAQVFPCTIIIYIYLLHCMYIDFIISEKLSCISRASCAQAPRKQKNAFGWSKKGGPQNRWSLPWKESSQNARGICPHNGGEKADNALQWRKSKRKQGAMSCPVAVVQPRLRIRLTEKKSAQVHCCWEIEA